MNSARLSVLPLPYAMIICLTALLTATAAALIFGATTLHLDDPISQQILLQIRLPRLFVAAFCGMALAVAGALCQGLFRNSLASPSVIGIDSAAALCAALVFYLGAGYWHWLSLPLGAVTGAALGTLLVLRAANSKHGVAIENLLLIGFSLAAFLGALTSLVVALSLERYQTQASLIYWLFGDLGSRHWEHLLFGAPAILVGLGLAGHFAYQLNVSMLGDEVAQSLHVDVRRLRRGVIIAMAFLVGGAVSMAGPIPFVGFLVPHLTRRIFGAEHRRLLLLSGINGMTLVLTADLLARVVRAPHELQVGIVVALLGAPTFAWVLIKERRQIS